MSVNNNQNRAKNFRPAYHTFEKEAKEEKNAQNTPFSQPYKDAAVSRYIVILEKAKKHWFKILFIIGIFFVAFKQNIFAPIGLINGKVVTENGVTSITKNNTNNNNKTTDKTIAKVAETPESSIQMNIGDVLGQKKASPMGGSELGNISENTKNDYLRRFAKVAVTEQEKYGIPASVVLANALIQSFAGKRDLTTTATNHFNLPMTTDWLGEKAKIGGKEYRKYPTAWLSFRDHSLFITTGKYKTLRQFSSKDYKAWARGLEELDYPSALGTQGLAIQIVEVIEAFGLHSLDK